MALMSRLLLILALAVPLGAMAEQSQDFGPYVVHYSAITTNTLLPEVAKQYDISRSRNRALLTVTVLKKVMNNTTGAPVSASVNGSATNLSAQLRTLDFRKVKEGNAIYYLAEFPVADKEVLDFVLQVVPEGETSPLTVRFRQQFFTEGEATFRSSQNPNP